MKTVTVTLRSTAPYSQGKHITEERSKKETAKDFEARTWRQRLHTNKDGNIVIPPMSFEKLPERGSQVSLDPDSRQRQKDVHQANRGWRHGSGTAGFGHQGN